MAALPDNAVDTWDGSTYRRAFECIVNAIACQQLSLTVGVRLLNRLVEAYGTTPANSARHAFPDPTRLAGIAPETLMPLGFSRAKARSIVELTGEINAGTFAAAAVETLDDREALQALLRLRGVGRWTAEYALLRGLGRLHVFPGDDVGARNNLARRLDRRGPRSPTSQSTALWPTAPATDRRSPAASHAMTSSSWRSAGRP